MLNSLTEVKDTPDLTARARLRLAGEIGRQIGAEATAGEPNVGEFAALDPLEIRNRSREMLVAETTRADVARRLPSAPLEKVKAFEEMLAMASAEARQPLKLLLDAFLDGILDQQSSELSRQARTYVGKVADEYVDELLKPRIQAQARRLQQAVSRRAGVAAERLATSARGLVARTIVYLAVEKPKELMDGAVALQIVAKESDLETSRKLLSIASTNVGEATRLVTQFGAKASSVGRTPATLDAMSFANRDLERPISEEITRNAARAKELEKIVSATTLPGRGIIREPEKEIGGSKGRGK